MFPYSDVDTVSRILIFKLFIRASCLDNESNLEPYWFGFFKTKAKCMPTFCEVELDKGVYTF